MHRPPLAHQLQHLLRLLRLRRVSSGKPSEKNLYADIDAAWQALRTWYGLSPENIILYGQSIGTVPTVHLASRYECAAVNSPFASDFWIACGFSRYQENIVL